MSRVFWKLYNSVKSLPEPWAWRLHWLPEATPQPFLPALAVPMYSFPQHNGGLSCNYLFKKMNNSHNFPLTCRSCSDHRFSSSVQDLPVQKQSDFAQDFYQSFAEYFSSECRSVPHFLHCLFWRRDNIKLLLSFYFQVFLRLRSLR